MKYPKINSLYKRDEKGKFLPEFSCSEFAYLYKNKWVATEKVDGTNIRVIWDGNVTFAGRTDNAVIPTPLLNKLGELFTKDKFNCHHLTLFGEGYGAGIQSGGDYGGVNFILFDVLINGFWLERKDIEEFAQKFNIGVVPILFEDTLENIEGIVKEGFKSTLKSSPPEGVVLKPAVSLNCRNGERVITKLKLKDFK